MDVVCRRTLGSASKHCHARARTSISRGEKETSSSLAMFLVEMVLKCGVIRSCSRSRDRAVGLEWKREG
jgi:hypothetical protein